MRLIRESEEPLQITFEKGKVVFVKITAHAGSMSTAELARLITQIEEREHWGKMQVSREGAEINVTWEIQKRKGGGG